MLGVKNQQGVAFLAAPTWNTALTGGTKTYSNGDRTVAKAAASTWSSAWSAEITETKFYFEMTFDSGLPATDIHLGVVFNPTSENVIYRSVGTGALHWNTGSEDLIVSYGGANSAGVAAGFTPVNGSSIGFAVDLTGGDGRIWARDIATGLWKGGVSPDPVAGTDGASFEDYSPGSWAVVGAHNPRLFLNAFQPITITIRDTLLQAAPSGFVALGS